ncbi:unnamed protein product [Pedinophyceae sp. YPF-701]|nr:unnamed protein product [Pedinophyceae sp. YPF-701]
MPMMLACSIIYMMVNQPEPRVRPYGAGQPSPAIEQAAMAHGARMVHELARHRRTAPPGTFNEGSVHSASVSSDDFPRGLYRRSRGGTLHEVPAQDASRALSGGDDEPDDGAVREAAHELAALQGAALGPAGVTVDPAGKVTMEVLRRETAVLAGQAGIELGFSGGGGPETPAGLRAAMRALREAMCTWDQGGGYEHEDDGSDIGSTGTPGDKKDN